ncbi:Transmembrane protein [Sesbania bispinosa]|nr:Transmembrane protein [Sesbania bispinosa]
MHLSENEGIEGKTFVVTGGLGFVGSALCLELIRRGAQQVRAFDLRHSSPWSHILKENGVHCIQGDVVRKEDVEKALRSADCVFHLAAFGMSGKEMLQFGRVDEVNINGTCHVIDACLDLGIKRLVYCSTYNVVFGGQQIINGNEALPYFPIDQHADLYGRSKSIAEQFVLKNNSRPFKNGSGDCLYTCAVRPAAIYGPGEDRHLPRIITMAKLGLILFRIGDQTVKSDWVYVDNLVLALILASMGLLGDNAGKGKRPIAAGQAYFISDGSPVNSFEFLQPLLRSLDYEVPKTTLKVEHALALGRICQGVYTILYPWLNRWWLPQPFILPSEVHKVGVTHYFSYLKAREEIGYVPMVTSQEGMASTISHWQKRKRAALDGPTIYAWLFCVIGMIAMFCGAFLPDIGIVSVLRAICLFVFRSMWMTRLVFFLATAAHTIEAIYAWYLAKKVDPANAIGWFWQTFALGMFSLRLLLKRAGK